VVDPDDLARAFDAQFGQPPRLYRAKLASAEYNARRADCEAGVLALARRFPGTRAYYGLMTLTPPIRGGELSLS
jgi:hypothetical protein